MKIDTKPKVDVIKGDEIPHLLLSGEVGAVLELTVKDKEGKVTEHRIMRSKSFVKQFLQLLWIQTFQIPEVVTYSVTDTGNVARAICESGLIFACDGGSGVVTHGIIAGTGTTAATISDYVIETLIAEGTGAGQLQYGAVTFGAPASSSTTSQFTITRDLANGSGASITVNEIALYVKGYIYNTTYYFMTIRDVISGGVAVPNGETLTVNYRPQAVV